MRTYGLFKREHTTRICTDQKGVSILNKKEAEKVKEIMESTVTLEVPNKVDYEEGDNWGSIK